jgi:hypothetical protein
VQGGGRSGVSPVPAAEGLQTLWSIIDAFACSSTATVAITIPNAATTTTTNIKSTVFLAHKLVL